jgi:hypothetical protein
MVGVPQDDAAGGTFVKIAKDGSVDITTGNEETISLNKTSKDVSISAGNNISTKSAKATNMDVGDSLNMNVAKDWILKAQGKASITVATQLNIKADAMLEAQSPMVSLKADSLFKVEAPVVQINATNIQLGLGGTPALVLNTKFLGVGNVGAPVISRAIGPFSTRVFVGS